MVRMSTLTQYLFINNLLMPLAYAYNQQYIFIPEAMEGEICLKIIKGCKIF